MTGLRSAASSENQRAFRPLGWPEAAGHLTSVAVWSLHFQCPRAGVAELAEGGMVLLGP